MTRDADPTCPSCRISDAEATDGDGDEDEDVGAPCPDYNGDNLRRVHKSDPLRRPCTTHGGTKA